MVKPIVFSSNFVHTFVSLRVPRILVGASLTSWMVLLVCDEGGDGAGVGVLDIIGCWFCNGCAGTIKSQDPFEEQTQWLLIWFFSEIYLLKGSQEPKKRCFSKHKLP